MLSQVLGLIVPVLAGLSVLAGLIFVFKALQDRTKSTRAAYGVGRQEARQSMQVDLVRGIAALFVGLILLGFYSVIPESSEGEPGVTPTQVTPDATQMVAPTSTIPPQVTATNTAVSIPTLAVPATPTTAVALPTATQPAPPTESPTPAPASATVQSGVGVYLRAAPSTTAEQLEWLLDGTVVFLLAGQQTADGFNWQQVRTADGKEGWVVADFLIPNQ